MHKDILNQLEDQQQLHSSIIEKFAEKPRRLDSLYKECFFDRLFC